MFTNGTLSHAASPYTRECREFIDSGGFCEVKDLTPTVRMMRITNKTTQCQRCQNLVQQEFRPENVDCSSPICDPACAWQLIDEYWCAKPSADGQTYTLTTRSVSGTASSYTSDCSQFINGGGYCEVPDASASASPITFQGAVLALIAVLLEASHLVCITVLQYSVRASHCHEAEQADLRRALGARRRKTRYLAAAQAERRDAVFYTARAWPAAPAPRSPDAHNPDAAGAGLAAFSRAVLAHSRAALAASLEAAAAAEARRLATENYAAHAEESAARRRARLRQHLAASLLSLAANAGCTAAKLFPFRSRNLCSTWACARLAHTSIMTLAAAAADVVERLLFLRVLATPPPPKPAAGCCAAAAGFRRVLSGRRSRAAHKAAQLCVSLAWVLLDLAAVYPQAPGTGPVALAALACLAQLPLAALDLRALRAAAAAARAAAAQRELEAGREGLVTATLGFLVPPAADTADTGATRNPAAAKPPPGEPPQPHGARSTVPVGWGVGGL